MAKVLITESYLQAIGAALRQKLGTDRVPGIPKERGESEGNFQRTTDSRINKGKWK